MHTSTKCSWSVQAFLNYFSSKLLLSSNFYFLCLKTKCDKSEKMLESKGWLYWIHIINILSFINKCSLNKNKNTCIESHCLVLCDDDEIEYEKCEEYYHLHKTKHLCVLGDGCLTKNDQKCVQSGDGYHLWIWM